MAHSMSCGVPRASAIRRASRAISSACRASMADSGCRRAVASPLPDDPFVAGGRARDQPIAATPHRGHDARRPVAGDRIGREDHAGRDRRDHALNDHRHAARRPCARTPSRARRARSPGSARRPWPGRRARHRARSHTCRRTNDRRRPRRSRSTGPRTGRCPRSHVPSAPVHVAPTTAPMAASAVTTTPSGTRTPAAISSPRLAALPPTSAESDDAHVAETTDDGGAHESSSVRACAMSARRNQSTSSAA